MADCEQLAGELQVLEQLLKKYSTEQFCVDAMGISGATCISYSIALPHCSVN
jgi:hypothetical protein